MSESNNQPTLIKVRLHATSTLDNRPAAILDEKDGLRRNKAVSGKLTFGEMKHKLAENEDMIVFTDLEHTRKSNLTAEDDNPVLFIWTELKPSAIRKVIDELSEMDTASSILITHMAECRPEVRIS